MEDFLQNRFVSYTNYNLSEIEVIIIWVIGNESLYRQRKQQPNIILILYLSLEQINSFLHREDQGSLISHYFSHAVLLL